MGQLIEHQKIVDGWLFKEGLKYLVDWRVGSGHVRRIQAPPLQQRWKSICDRGHVFYHGAFCVLNCLLPAWWSRALKALEYLIQPTVNVGRKEIGINPIRLPRRFISSVV